MKLESVALEMIRKALVPDTENCLFCMVATGTSDVIKQIDKYRSAVCFYDSYPVTEGHTLIVPIDHIETYYDIPDNTRKDIDVLLKIQSSQLLDDDKTITGFNIGWNCGKSAGQTIFHAHCHLIPRRDGDIEDPTGGIRGVIPNKRIY